MAALILSFILFLMYIGVFFATREIDFYEKMNNKKTYKLNIIGRFLILRQDNEMYINEKFDPKIDIRFRDEFKYKKNPKYSRIVGKIAFWLQIVNHFYFGITVALLFLNDYTMFIDVMPLVFFLPYFIYSLITVFIIGVKQKRVIKKISTKLEEESLLVKSQNKSFFNFDDTLLEKVENESKEIEEFDDKFID